MKGASQKESVAGTSEGSHYISMRFALVKDTNGGMNICLEISVFAVWDSFRMPYDSMLHPIQLAWSCLDVDRDAKVAQSCSLSTARVHTFQLLGILWSHPLLGPHDKELQDWRGRSCSVTMQIVLMSNFPVFWPR